MKKTLPNRMVLALIDCAVLTMLFGAAGSPAFADPTPIKVFLLAGQSNMGGRADASGLPPALQGEQTDVQFYYDSTLSYLKPGNTTDPDYFGPEITFGRTIADAYPTENVALIKCAEGSTNLFEDWAPPDGDNYLTFLSEVSGGMTALTDAGYAPEIVGMLWTQGERDAYLGRTTAQYTDDLTAFIADMRSNYGAGLPFFLSRLSTNQTAYGAGLYEIRAAQEAVAAADPLTYMIDTDTFSVQGDNVHFDADGQMDLGVAFASAYSEAATTSPAPEPAGLGLLGLALLGLRKRSRS